MVLLLIAYPVLAGPAPAEPSAAGRFAVEAPQTRLYAPRCIWAPMLRHPLDCNGWLRRRSHADPAVRAALGLGARSAPPDEAGWKRFYHCWDTGFGVASIGVGATL